MIEIKNVSKSFEEKRVFEDFNMKIDSGEFVVFAGKSGCGKTTLLNMIGGLEKPDKGSILVDGKDIFSGKNRKHFYTYQVGFLFQNFALVENKTVRQNMELVQKKARTEKSIEEILESVGIPDKMDTKVYKLSGGEQQRTALARLMYKKCNLILADEPTGSLDEGNAREVMKILHIMNQEGKTVILVTHNEKIINEEKRVVML